MPDDPQDFAFSAGGGLSPAGFSLDDDANATLSNTQTFTNVVPGAGYTLNETVPSGWDQTSATCSDGSPVSNIDVAPGETVTCTWVNTKRASLTVAKDAVPNDPQDFAFNVAVPGGGSLELLARRRRRRHAARNSSRTFNNVAPGPRATSVVGDGAGAAGTSRAATCDDGSPVIERQLSAAARASTCTFTNQQARPDLWSSRTPRRTTRRTSRSRPGGGLSPASFSLDDDSDPTLSNTPDLHQRGGRAPATRSPRPCRPDGTSRAPPATTAARSRTSRVSGGETVTCTFTNRKRGQIIVVKDSLPDDAAGLRASPPAGGLSPASFSLDDDADGTLSNTRSFTGVVPQAGLLGRRAFPPAGTRRRRPVQRRQPGLEHRRLAGRDRSPARSPTASGARSWWSRTRRPTTRRTSPSRRRRPRRRELQPRRRRQRDAVQHPDAQQRRARLRLLALGDGAGRAGTRRPRPVTTAAHPRTSTSRPARR